MTKTLLAAALLTAAAAAPALAQAGGRISLEPYAAYGFFGTLPDNGPRLEAAAAFGGRAALQVSPQFAVFANAQRSQPKVEGVFERKATVDHWSAGVEFSFVPRGGAEGMLPVLLEAGLGEVRYDLRDVLGGPARESDLAAKLALSSALRITPNFAIRYGASDYISNFRDRGIANQIFAELGAELRF